MVDKENGAAGWPRIAYLTGHYPKVSHTFIQREVAALRALGADVATLTIRETSPDERPGPEEQEAHRTTFRVLARARNPLRLAADHVSVALRRPAGWLSALALAWRTRPPGLKALLWQLFYFLEAGVVAAHLRRIGADRLHNHFGDSSGSVTMLAATMAALPFSITLHGPTIFFEPEKWRLDEKIARADFIVCISHFCRSQAMLFSDPARWDRLEIVHCGVDPDLYAPAESRGAGGPVALFVGRLAAVKGVPVLLDAFARIAPRHPDARLVLVGDGEERPALEVRAARLGVDGRVEFAGYQRQAEVARRLAEADLFVLPSFAEGVPVALMEAMAAGLPVIAPRVAGVEELVAHERAGLVLPPGDVASLAGALDRLLGDAALRARMGEAGRRMVEAEFTTAASAEALLALFRRPARSR